jgi:DNA-binding winged helix-turn-helix (wHTH) protein/tetratricopeptide (TPR) repeat protein
MPLHLDRTDSVYRFGPFRLEERRLLLTVDGEPIAFGPKVVETLLALVRHSGTLVKKDELMAQLWPNGFVEDANLTQNVYLLRRVLRAHGVDPAIETMARRGYRFIAPVALETPPTAGRLVRSTRAVAWRRVVAAAACIAILIGVGRTTPSRTPASRTLRPDVARHYAMGRYYWNLRTVDGLERSVGYFESVVKAEPRSALGYAGLADAYTELHDYVCDEHPCPALAAKASRYARDAVAHEPDSAEARTSLAMTERLFAHDDARAEVEFRNAIALDPNDALAHEWYGNALLARGETAPARLELERAVALQPVATATYAWLARAAYYDRRFAEAIAHANEALALNPNRVETLVVLGLAYEQTGNADRALDTFGKLKRIGGDTADADVLIAAVRARTGDPGAVAALRRARDLGARNRYAATDLALAFVAASDYANALRSMRALTFPSPMERAFFALDPRLDPVRNDRRFRAWTQPAHDDRANAHRIGSMRKISANRVSSSGSPPTCTVPFAIAPAGVSSPAMRARIPGPASIVRSAPGSTPWATSTCPSSTRACSTISPTRSSNPARNPRAASAWNVVRSAVTSESTVIVSSGRGSPRFFAPQRPSSTTTDSSSRPYSVSS